MAGGHGSDGDGNFFVHGCVILRERWISVLRDLLKFAKCPYWCLITALYGSSGKIIRGVIVFRRVPVSYSDYSYEYSIRGDPWCFRHVNTRP